jgi:hypothetical protein
VTLSGAGNLYRRSKDVGLDGRVEPPVTTGSGPVAFRLSNDLPTGPTTYFLLELLPK